MKSIRWTLAVLGLAILPACWGSKVPLDEKPQVTIDRALLGTWACIPGEPEVDESQTAKLETADSGHLPTLRFSATGDRTYEIEENLNGPEKKEKHLAYLSKLGPHVILNARETDKPDSEWALVRVRVLAPYVLALEEMKSSGKDADELTKSTALRTFAEKELREGRLKFEPFLLCSRAKPKS